MRKLYEEAFVLFFGSYDQLVLISTVTDCCTNIFTVSNKRFSCKSFLKSNLLSEKLILKQSYSTSIITMVKGITFLNKIK